MREPHILILASAHLDTPGRVEELLADDNVPHAVVDLQQIVTGERMASFRIGDDTPGVFEFEDVRESEPVSTECVRSVWWENGGTGANPAAAFQGMGHDAIAALIREWRPTLLVVGMPAHADGSPSDIQPAVDAFIAELGRYDLPITTVDERFTSLEAERILKEARAGGSRGRISKEDIDSAAAVFIAERYLLSE